MITKQAFHDKLELLKKTKNKKEAILENLFLGGFFLISMVITFFFIYPYDVGFPTTGVSILGLIFLTSLNIFLFLLVSLLVMVTIICSLLLIAYIFGCVCCIFYDLYLLAIGFKKEEELRVEEANSNKSFTNYVNPYETFNDNPELADRQSMTLALFVGLFGNLPDFSLISDIELDDTSLVKDLINVSDKDFVTLTTLLFNQNKILNSVKVLSSDPNVKQDIAKELASDFYTELSKVMPINLGNKVLNQIKLLKDDTYRELFLAYDKHKPISNSDKEFVCEHVLIHLEQMQDIINNTFDLTTYLLTKDLKEEK